MTFVVFDPSPLTLWKTAVLLPNLCNVSFCNYGIYLSSFSILEIAAVRHTRLSKLKL